MQLKGTLLFLFFGLMVVVPYSAQSALITYSVSGEGTLIIGDPNDSNSNIYLQTANVGGHFVISNEPTELYNNQDSTFYYRFAITEFSLNIEQYNFSGTGRISILGSGAETIWTLFGTGNWTYWQGDSFNGSFYNADGTLYDRSNYNEFLQLPPVILLTDLEPYLLFSNTIPPARMTFNSNLSQGMYLTRVGQVPELSTMLLLGSGLVGWVGYGRKRLKK